MIFSFFFRGVLHIYTHRNTLEPDLVLGKPVLVNLLPVHGHIGDIDDVTSYRALGNRKVDGVRDFGTLRGELTGLRCG